MQISGAALSDTGRKRPVNEDSYGYFENERLFILSDGMGGHVGGQLASRLAVEAINEYCRNHSYDEDATLAINFAFLPSRNGKRLKSAIQYANQKIFEQAQKNPAYQGMGATVVALLFEKDSVNIGNVGDSRIYLIRDNAIRQLTEDHSLLAELLRRREITPEAAKTFPYKNVITRALGRKDVIVDTSSEKCRDNDFFVLCSDGLSNMVPDQEILQIVLNQNDLNLACHELVDLANRRGGTDNITVIVLKVND
ncbi:MAG: Stp1/IreP family PP2C-type Ser/Thr phosphatase [Candidatus Schekmanbacteria bacterium]|nr:Stp1/IreP family PP2C-type Ser/Thr phosphatase [Candidatus Schekmanbacteria bacterium]